MSVELDALLPVLVALLVLLLCKAAARRVGRKAWFGLGLVLLVALVTKPDKEQQLRAVGQRAAVELHGKAAPLCMPLMAELRTGEVGPAAEYHDFGVASAVTLHGRTLSFGVLGQVWIVDLNRLSHSMR